MDNIQSLMEFIKITDNLKMEKRWDCYPHWNGLGDELFPDVVAGHSWKVSLLIIILIKEFNIKNIDISRILEMSIIHDLGESFVGDISADRVARGEVSKEEKSILEIKAFEKLGAYLSENARDYVLNLYEEYCKVETRETKLLKCFDRLECLLHVINHSKWGENLKLKELVGLGVYGNEYFVNFPELKTFIDNVKLRLKEKYEKFNLEWKDEYNIKWN